MSVLTREEIVALAKAPKTKLLEDVPELSVPVVIRRLSGGDRDERDLWAQANAWSEEDEKAGRGRAGNLKPGTRHVRAGLVAMSICDEAGERLFDHTNAEDMKIVNGMDGETLDFLYDQVREFNGIGAAAEEKVAKNSDGDQSDGSG